MQKPPAAAVHHLAWVMTTSNPISVMPVKALDNLHRFTHHLKYPQATLVLKKIGLDPLYRELLL